MAETIRYEMVEGDRAPDVEQAISEIVGKMRRCYARYRGDMKIMFSDRLQEGAFSTFHQYVSEQLTNARGIPSFAAESSGNGWIFEESASCPESEAYDSGLFLKLKYEKVLKWDHTGCVAKKEAWKAIAWIPLTAITPYYKDFKFSAVGQPAKTEPEPAIA